MTTTKIALVTGGSRGLGKDMAMRLAEKGIDVVLTYHSKQDEAQAVVAAIEQMGRKAAAIQLNTADVKTFDAFFATCSTVLKDTFGAANFRLPDQQCRHGAGIHHLHRPPSSSLTS